MVVGHFRSVCLREEVLESQPGGRVPDFLHLRGGRALREELAVERRPASAHHVEQDAVACVVALRVGHASPVLRAQAPGVGLVLSAVEGGHAVVFGVEEDDVDADGGLPLLDEACQFEQHAHAAGSVVGAQDGFALAFLVALGVGIGAAVPVGAEQDSAAVLGLIGADDVACLQDGVVVGHEVGFLHLDGGSELP